MTWSLLRGRPGALEDLYLPGEELVKGYPQLRVDRRGGYAGFLTTHRLFLQGSQRLYDIDPTQVNYLERCRKPRYSPLWLLLTLLLIGAPGLAVFMLIVGWLAWWFIRAETLVIGTAARQWMVMGDPAMLDDLARNLRLGQTVERHGGGYRAIRHAIRDAEPVAGPVPELPPQPEPEVEAVNESRPRKAVHAGLVVAFILYYASTFGAATGFWIFLSLVGAAWAFKVLTDRRAHNRHHGLEPKPGLTERGWGWLLGKVGLERRPARWSFRAFGREWRLRSVGAWALQGLLAIGLLWTLGAQNMRPLLFALALGAPIYLGCRAFAALPGPPLRLVARSALVLVVAVMVVLPALAWAPFFLPATAALPPEHAQGDSGNGWELQMQDYQTMGLGLVELQFSVYVDDGRDTEDNQDGYAAFLVVVAIKLPVDALDEKNLLDEIEREFKEQSLEEDVNLTAQILNGSRQTAQGYTTQYFIYNATAKGRSIDVGNLYSQTVTEGSEARYIGEAWKAPELNLLVIAIGIAIISNEEAEKNPPPPEQLPDPVKELWEQAGEMKDELIPDPSDTTDTRNWIELLDLIPQVHCEGEPR